MGKIKDISNQSNILDLDFDMFDNRDCKETTYNISARQFRQNAKILTINAMKKESLEDVFKTLPEENEYIHLIGNGKYDYYTFIPVMISRLSHIDELYGSTWTMNRSNCEDLFKRFDSGDIGNMSIITGLYFKRRETAVYASLVEGLNKRGQKFISCENHAKVILIKFGNAYYVIEGSANWTSNPRIEQNVIVRSEKLYKFHQDWMDEIFRSCKS